MYRFKYVKITHLLIHSNKRNPVKMKLIGKWKTKCPSQSLKYDLKHAATDQTKFIVTFCFFCHEKVCYLGLLVSVTELVRPFFCPTTSETSWNLSKALALGPSILYPLRRNVYENSGTTTLLMPFFKVPSPFNPFFTLLITELLKLGLIIWVGSWLVTTSVIVKGWWQQKKLIRWDM